MGEPIPAPPMSEFPRWEADQVILNSDPRTAGSMPRPRWLVERVLREHAARAASVSENERSHR